MAGSPTDAANAAIDRLRTLREQAKRRREQVKLAVRDVRERNREESTQAMLRVRGARRHATPAWPAAPRQDQQTMHLYEDDEPESAAQRPSTAPRQPAHVDDDDWSNETWLH